MRDAPVTAALVRRPAVEPQRLLFGPVALEAIGTSTILQILAPFGRDTATLDLPADARPAGPGQWLVVRDGEARPAEVAILAAMLASRAALVDQSHGRARFRASGPVVRDMLAKLVPVDLASDTFHLGDATMTIAGHVGVHLARTGEDEFELLPLRGFAASLWDDLQRSSADLA